MGESGRPGAPPDSRPSAAQPSRGRPAGLERAPAWAHPAHRGAAALGSIRTLPLHGESCRGTIAVGTPVARRPPHRSRRAELPHRAPALGDDAQALLLPWVADAQPVVPASGLTPTQSGSASGVGAAEASFLRPGSFPPPPPPGAPQRAVRSRASTVLRACLTSRVRASPVVPPWSSRRGLRLIVPESNLGSPGSRARCVLACMGSRDRVEPVRSWPCRCARCGLPRAHTASALQSDHKISRLDGQPASAPVNASRPPLRTNAHDSGSV